MTEPESDSDSTRVLGASAGPSTAAPTGRAAHVLPPGTRLSEEFEVVGLVGQGGFGIVYLADDHSLQRRVAVKEYMPAALALRGEGDSVVLKSERDADTFQIGLRSFVNEARLLAHFDHPALLKVFRFWEANGTAYMAMPYYAGQTLKQALAERGQPPDESWIRQLLRPIMDALALLHRENCFHRDVAPDNIMLLADDKPVLLDFGAARRVIGDMTQALTVILKPGYAPIEQYAEMPGMRQGAWTDVYALAAVVHWMITGQTPPPAVGRMMQDSYAPLATVAAGRYSERFLRGIDQCLSVKGEDRPQTMAAMRELLGLDALEDAGPPPAAQPEPPVLGVAQPQTTASATATTTAGKSETPTVGKRGIWLAAGAVVLTGSAALLWWQASGSREERPSPPSAAEIVPAPAPAPTPASPAPAPIQAPAPLPPPAIPPITLSLTTPDGHTRYRQGEAISVRVTPQSPAWIYCFMQDAKGQVQRFFPNRFQPSAEVGTKGLELPGRLKFRINADFSGRPETLACLASPVALDGEALVTRGDFVALDVANLEDLRARLATAAGPSLGWARLDLQRR